MNKKLIATIATAAVALTISTGSVALADNGKGKDRLTSLLSGLVAKGTITQSQADAIVKAQTDAMAAGKAAMETNRAAVDAVVTATLGITTDAIKARLKAGESLATIAGAKKDTLIAAITAEINRQIDAAVVAGKLTAAQGAERKAKTAENVTKRVNNLRPPHGDKPGRSDKNGAKPTQSPAAYKSVIKVVKA
jgi:polyhydroxyalkanoate synthesis regulator phasin